MERWIQEKDSKTERVAIVTGAGSGIGRATAEALLDDGWCVVLAGRRKNMLDTVIQAYLEKGGGNVRAVAVAADVSDPASVENLFHVSHETFGRLDLLFNNAGMGVEGVSVEALSIARWKTMLDVNVTGTLLCTQAAFHQMRAQNPGGGRIINNGSLSAHVPRLYSADYTASKHAVSGLTKACALDGRKYGIAVCQIDFGNAQTDMAAQMGEGVLQANGERAPEPVMDVSYAARSVAYMASLPLEANVQFMTVMATAMPFIGRG